MRPAITNRTRLIAWGGLALLIVVRGVAHILPLSVITDATIMWGLSLVPMPVSAVASFIVWSRVRGEERRFWLLLGLGATLLTFSESYWAYQVVFVDPMGPALPHPFELIQATAAFLFFAMVVALTRFGAEPLSVRARYYADIGLLAVVLFVTAYRWLITPLFADIPRHSTGLLLVGSVYPVLGVALLSGTFAVLVGFKAYRWRPWEQIFAAALTVYSIGILAWPWWYLSFQTSEQPIVTGSFLEYALMAGHYLLFVACVYRLSEIEGPAVPRAVSAPLGRWPWLARAYPGVMTLALPVLVWASVRAGDTVDSRVYLGAAVALVTLLALRSWLVTLEADHLFFRSVTDSLTGVANRRALDMLLSAHGPTWTGTALVIDIDGFEWVNETGGHAEGDRVLRQVSFILATVIGDGGQLFRTGGDDYVILLPGIDAEEGVRIASECVVAVEAEVRRGSTPVSISAGVAETRPSESDVTLGEVLQSAHRAQRRALAAGGGRVSVADHEIVQDADPAEALRESRRGRYLAALRALAATVDAREPRAGNHSRNVAAVAVGLGRELGFSQPRLDDLETAALLHDIGKLVVDDRLLQRGALSVNERAVIEEHPALGLKILASAGVDKVLPWILHHHERWDGTGYPGRLAGTDIPLEARVLAIADAYDVMTCGRDYQPELGHHAALRQIELEAGAQFDPSLATTFARIMWDETPGRPFPGARACVSDAPG